MIAVMLRTASPLALLAALLVAACGDPEDTPDPTDPPVEPVLTERVLAEAIPAYTRAEVACLARTAYHEARGEGRQGMAAVAHVVLNRAEAPAFPDDVCAVAMQGAEGRSNGGCQFSWACDGEPDEPKNLVAYGRALDVARSAVSGKLEDPTGGAVMFHAARVTPYWTREAEQTARIGSHLFYRLD